MSFTPDSREYRECPLPPAQGARPEVSRGRGPEPRGQRGQSARPGGGDQAVRRGEGPQGGHQGSLRLLK